MKFLKNLSFRSLSLLAVGVLLLLQGCLHYSCGTGTRLTFDKIYVAPIKNDSFAPQAQAILTKKIRSKLANHPGLTLVSSPENCAILEISIVRFSESKASAQENDTICARSFDMQMTISATLKNSISEEILFQDRKFSDSVECFLLQNFQDTKHQSMALLTEKLATKIYEAVCLPW